jgi:amidohydrolase
LVHRVAEVTDPKARAEATVRDLEPRLRDIATWMYHHPEIAHQEHEASTRLGSFLSGHGFAVDSPAWGLDTAFDAKAGSSGPEVVICAEMDALPEVGHACGHNIIGTAAAAAGVALAPLVGDLGIRVRVLGTPAEEGHGGKVDLLEAGAFEGVAAAMMIHPATSDAADPTCLAVKRFLVAFHGKEAHAATEPHLGRNALDAAVQAYNNIGALRQALPSTDRVHGVITYGGAAPNVIPAFTEMSYYVRSPDATRLNELYPRVAACFAAAATATGCRLEITPKGNDCHELAPDPLIAAAFAANANELGRPMARGGVMTGSTDMGNVSRVVPSIHPMLDIHSAPAVNHQRDFAAHTITTDGIQAITDGAIAMAWTVIDLATEDRWDELGSALR